MKAMRCLSLVVAGAILGLTCHVAKADDYVSPDESMTVTIESNDAGDVLQVADKSGSKVTASMDLQEHKGNSDGEVVNNLEWSSDSQFFAFSCGNQGGHQPWHWPTYIYSRSLKKFYSVDKIFGDVSNPDFEWSGKHTLKITLVEGDKKISIDPTKDLETRKKASTDP